MGTNQLDVLRPKDSTDQWHTPQWVIDKSRTVLGGIGLDPASSDIANQRVGAAVFYTALDNPLHRDWFGSVFVNPPGGKTGRTLPKAFWNKLLTEIELGNVPHAIFLSYRLEMVRTTQLRCKRSTLEFPTCIFSRRLVFVRETGEEVCGVMSPSCITYIPGSINNTKLFVQEFGDSGVIVG